MFLRRRLKPVVRFIATLAASSLTTAGAQDAVPDPDLVRSHYDLEVASYCGLVTRPVAEGFHVEVRRIMDRTGLSRADLELARMEAWKEAHKEWQNRGLGGFRAWCAGDAKDSANRLAAQRPAQGD